MSRLTRQLGLDAQDRQMVEAAWLDWAHYFGFDIEATAVFRDLALSHGTKLRGALPPGYWWEIQEDGSRKLMGNIEHAAFERIAGPIHPMNDLQLKAWRTEGHIVGPQGETDIWIVDPINPHQHFITPPGESGWPLASAYWANDNPWSFPTGLYYFSANTTEFSSPETEVHWWPSSDLWWGNLQGTNPDVNWYASRDRAVKESPNGRWIPIGLLGLTATDD